MRSTDTRRQIVDAALALLAERGYTATAVDDIATAAGVAKGSVFYNFGSKAELFEAIIAAGVARLTDALRTAVDGRDGWDAVEALVTELLTQVRDHPDFAKVLVAEVFRTVVRREGLTRRHAAGKRAAARWASVTPLPWP